MFRFRKFLDAPVVVSDNNIYIYNFFSVYVELKEFRLFLQGVIRPYRYDDFMAHVYSSMGNRLAASRLLKAGALNSGVR